MQTLASAGMAARNLQRLPFHSPKITCAASLLVGALILTAFCQAQTQPDSGNAATNEIELRGQLLLMHFVEQERQPSFAGVAARYATGERVSEAHRMLGELLARPSTAPADAFYRVAIYLFGRQNLPYALAESIKRSLAEVPTRRGEAEHQWHMYHAALLLAAETWPDTPAEQWFNGKSSAENLLEAKSYFNAWITQLVENGQSEYDSPQFMPAFFATLALMHEFTRDDLFRKRLKVVLNLIMLDFASEHLDGLYAGAHSRISEAQIMSPREALSAGFAWLYFGAGKMVPSPELLFASLSSFELASVIRELATNRDPLGGYVHRERKRAARFLRSPAHQEATVCKYNYITRQYILGSHQGGLFYPAHQHSWGLTYLAQTDERPTLFISCPSASASELALFHADEPRVLLAEAGSPRHRRSQESGLTGASAYERLFQHRNVLLGLYDTPDSLRQVRLHGFFSDDLQDLSVTTGGGNSLLPGEWIFCRAAETFIAVLPMQPFRFEKIAGGRLFVSEGPRNGFVIEVSTPLENASFEEFQRRVREVANLTVDQDAGATRVRYTTSYGDRMLFSYNAATGAVRRLLNGLPVTAETCPLFESQFMRYFPDQRRLVLRLNNQWLELDFAKWEVNQGYSEITNELRGEWR
ncbi:MAG: hypothetical protein ONB48_09830 [candidate division KSB1 bacterium]|nr:hypothetical protein [candidate division KSB1 bacterium]MDZ7273787.1 hypothetical protein [candidate division KSB1 bacterium]MDZ7285943.1 hypothetical protein [candidate division KSB1 bacterium]MDZ7298975.1 hypothetical protein [candidate division KSB1 bacterium]MDZ7309491.1 hypothetical protein [candidate division KSB1 bacterium]